MLNIFYSTLAKLLIRSFFFDVFPLPLQSFILAKYILILRNMFK